MIVTTTAISAICSVLNLLSKFLCKGDVFMQGRGERGWLADCIVTRGEVHSGLALFADEDGKILRLSRDPEDIARATKLTGRAILPGLVNGHSHTFQRV